MNQMKKKTVAFISALLVCALILSSMFFSIAADAAVKTKMISMTKGQTKTIKLNIKKKVKKMTVKSSKKSVATAKRKGKAVKITAKKKGTAVIKVKVEYGKKRKKTFRYKVTVKDRKKAVVSGEKKESPSVSPASEKDRNEKDDPEPTDGTGGTYTPKYSYEVSIVKNPEYHLYSNQKILFYIQTENPDPERINISFDNSLPETITIYSSTGYSDVHYDDSRGYPNVSYYAQPVEGGYLSAVEFATPGTHTLVIEEGSEENEWGWSEYVPAEKYEVTVEDYQEAEIAWADEVIEYARERLEKGDQLIEQVLDNGKSIFAVDLSEEEISLLNDCLYGRYDAGGSSYAIQILEEYTNKPYDAKLLECISSYIYKNFQYDLSNSDGKVIHLASREGVYWERKWIDCWDATDIMCLFSERLGLNSEQTYAGYRWHYYATIYINGKGYIYDACPYSDTGLVTDWEYVI